MAESQDDTIPLPVMGLTRREYEAAFTYLDATALHAELTDLENRRQRTTVLEIPHTPWYKRPECWAIMLGSISLSHGIFVQWIYPRILISRPTNPPKGLRPPPAPAMDLGGLGTGTRTWAETDTWMGTETGTETETETDRVDLSVTVSGIGVVEGVYV